MIEIKNKHMVLFPEDRLIGAAGDVDSARRKFVLSRVQDEFDLSDMVAWIKIDPTGSGEDPYEQMLKKEISGDKIILTWTLSAANLKKAGELGVQIIFAATDYFNEKDLAGLSDNDFVVPAVIKGVSAPVWQSYPETFVVCESIDDTVAYEEMTKNVLVSAAASAIGSAESAAEAANSAESSAQSARVSALSASTQAQESKQAVSDAKTILNRVELVSIKTDESAALAQSYCNAAAEKVKEAEQVANRTQQLRDETQSICEEAHSTKRGIKDIADQVTVIKGEADESAALAAKNAIAAAESAALAGESAVLAAERADEAQVVKEQLDSKEDKSNKVKKVSGAYAEDFGEEDYLSARANDRYIDYKLENFEEYLIGEVIPPMTTQDMVNEINKETVEYGRFYFPSVKAVVDYVDVAAQYRKIFEHTIAEGEDIVRFDIEQDVEGNSFNLSEFVVYWEHPGLSEVASGAASYLKVCLKVEGQDYSFNGASIPCLRGENVRYARLEFHNLGRWIANGAYSGVASNNIGIVNLSTSGTRTGAGTAYDGKPAIGIRLAQAGGTSAPFVVGTKVEIWGR